jgi:hypothetical protein
MLQAQVWLKVLQHAVYMADTKHLLQVLQLEMENSSVVCKMEV